MAALLAAMVVSLAAAGCEPVPPPPPPGPVVVPPGFSVTTQFEGLDQPTVIRAAGDGRLFVAEKAGRVKVFDGMSDIVPDVLADLSPAVYDFWDHGLLGLAVDPAFPSRPYVYVLYAYDAGPRWGDACPDPPGATTDGCVVNGRLSRLQVGPANTLVGGEHVLLENAWCTQFSSHGIGSLAFGDDGALYLSAGDGASFNGVDYGQAGGSPGSPVPANPCGDPGGPVGTRLSPPTAEGGALRAQDLRSAGDPLGYGGSILRIHPDTGAAMPDNPLVGQGRPEAARVIAHGMRNPFRFSPRPGTDEIWTGDVGWSTDEELNRIADVDDGVVENFGWPCFEGMSRQAGYESAGLELCNRLYAGDNTVSQLTPPAFSYPHASPPDVARCGTGGASISGVAFYPGGSYPAEYDGALFFSDYTRGCLWAMRLGAGGQPDPATITTIAHKAEVVHLEAGPGGDLLMVDLLKGKVYRLGYAANRPPTAVINANPTSGLAPLAVTFDATRSQDPEGGPLQYEWDLDGDGAYDDAFGAQVGHTYPTAATVDAGLRVTDDHGGTATATVEIQAGNRAPAAEITAPDGLGRWAVGDRISFSGSGTDPDEAQLPDTAFTWQLTIHHCASPEDCHEHPLQRFTGRSGAFDAPDHEYPSYLTLDLTVTDANGLKATDHVRLDPRTVPLTFTSTPPGLQVTVGDARHTTPFTREVIVGSVNSVSAPSPQTIPAGTFAFQGWNDGGATTRTIVAPAEPTTHHVTFTQTAPSPRDGVAWVSDLPWLSSANGWGPAERDRSNGEQGATDGRSLLVGGVVYDKGVGVHANSQIRLDLNGRCSSFDAVAGLDDEVGANGSVSFSVLVDGVPRYDSGVLTGNSVPALVEVPVHGAEELTLVVNDGGDNDGFDHADWASARVTCIQPSTPWPPDGDSWVSDIPWVSSVSGYGPAERDRSTGDWLPSDGQRLVLGGVTHNKGIGVHANSQIRVALNGRCTAFTSVVGIDDEVGTSGSVSFTVLVDGVPRYDSGVMTGNSPPALARVPLNGAQEVTLVVNDGGDGLSWDHADWASARLTCG
jgi:glucose/arabinose dehydrogenase